MTAQLPIWEDYLDVLASDQSQFVRWPPYLARGSTPLPYVPLSHNGGSE